MTNFGIKSSFRRFCRDYPPAHHSVQRPPRSAPHDGRPQALIRVADGWSPGAQKPARAIMITHGFGWPVTRQAGGPGAQVRQVGRGRHEGVRCRFPPSPSSVRQRSLNAFLIRPACCRETSIDSDPGTAPRLRSVFPFASASEKFLKRESEGNRGRFPSDHRNVRGYGASSVRYDANSSKQ